MGDKALSAAAFNVMKMRRRCNETGETRQEDWLGAHKTPLVRARGDGLSTWGLRAGERENQNQIWSGEDGSISSASPPDKVSARGRIATTNIRDVPKSLL